jgi:hypothetical protein
MNSRDANLVNQPHWCHNKPCGQDTSLFKVWKFVNTTKMQVKLSLCTPQSYMWERIHIYQRILTSPPIRCKWVFRFIPRPLYPLGKSPQCLWNWTLNGPQNTSGCLLLPGMEACSSVVQTITYSHTDYTLSVCTICEKSVTGNDVLNDWEPANYHATKQDKSVFFPMKPHATA